MEEGLIPDMSHAQVLQLAWQRGAPEIPTLFGMKLKNRVKFKPEQTLKITASRCTECGFLKLYAREPDGQYEERG
jgi:hypothetical protein